MIEQLLNMTNDMYAVVDKDFTVMYANKKWIKVNSEVSGKDANIGCNLLELYTAEKRNQIVLLFDNVRKSESPIIKTHIKFGHSVYDIIYKKLKDDHIALVARDITTYTLSLEKNVIEKNAINQFLSRTSHELRTPLNSIIGFSDLISMENINTSIKEYNKYIKKSGEMMLHLVDDILMLTKIKQNKMTISIECYNMIPIIYETIELLKNSANNNNISIECNLSKEESFNMKVDIYRIKQILVNLISNSIKFNKPNGNIYINCISNENNSEIIIRDTGIGIKQEYLEIITEPFRRIDSTKHIEGSGLGLSLVTELTKLMHGTFTIDSKFGEWTETKINFPTCCKDKIKNKDDIIPKNPKYKIVYIEDNKINHLLMKSIISKMDIDIELIEAMQGSIGIDIVKENKPDILLLDMHLPDINGDVVANRILEWNKDQIIIIVSADPSESTMKRMKDKGIHHYITKPINTLNVMKLIKSILEEN